MERGFKCIYLFLAVLQPYKSSCPWRKKKGCKTGVIIFEIAPARAREVQQTVDSRDRRYYVLTFEPSFQNKSGPEYV